MSSILKNGNFLRYFLADSFAKIADNFFFLFLTWLALQTTGSPAYAGALLMANAIPRLVFMLFGGSLADKISPQIILRTGNILQAAGLLLILFWLMTGTLPIPWLFVIAILFGTVDAFSAPASMSAIPRIVPKSLLLKANSLIQGSEMVIFMVGSLLAGIVLQFGSMEVATAFNLGLYVIAAIMFFTIKIKFINESETDKKESELKRILSGLKYAWKKPIIRANLMLLAVTNIAVSGPITIGLLLLITQSLGLTPIYYSIVSAAFGAGALLGAIGAGFMKEVKGPGRLIIASYIVNGLAFIGMALVGNVWLIVIFCVVAGGIGGVASAVNSTWVQAITKTSMLGRVSALMMIAALAFDPFSQAFSGVIAEWSIEGLFIVAGLFIIVATFLVIPFNKVLLSKDKLPLSDQKMSSEL